MSASLLEALETSAREGCAFVLLARGRGFTLIDEEDLELVEHIRILSRDSGGYALGVLANGKRQRLHRFLLGNPDVACIDHCNQNKLDNRKLNLRLGSKSQNGANAKIRKVGNRVGRGFKTSQYKGVGWDKYRSKWRAFGVVSGKMIHLGRFDDETEAARSRDAWAKNTYGEFSTLNFP